MTNYMAGKAPEMDRDNFMLMLHGGVGDDNATAGVFNKADLDPGTGLNQAHT